MNGFGLLFSKTRVTSTEHCNTVSQSDTQGDDSVANRQARRRGEREGGGFWCWAGQQVLQGLILRLRIMRNLNL